MFALNLRQTSLALAVSMALVPTMGAVANAAAPTNTAAQYGMLPTAVSYGSAQLSADCKTLTGSTNGLPEGTEVMVVQWNANGGKPFTTLAVTTNGSFSVPVETGAVEWALWGYLTTGDTIVIDDGSVKCSIQTIDIPPAPPVVDDVNVKDDAHYVKPADTAKLTWAVNADGTATVSVKSLDYVFTDGTREHIYPKPVDKYNPPAGDVVIDIPPAPPVEDHKYVKDDAHYVKPADTAKLTWTVNTDGTATAKVKPGYIFTDGTKAHAYPKPADTYITSPPPSTPTPVVPKPTRPADSIVRSTQLRKDCSGAYANELTTKTTWSWDAWLNKWVASVTLSDTGWIKVSGLSRNEFRKLGCKSTKPVAQKPQVWYTVQVDRLAPRTTAQANLVAALDNDGLLKYREDRPLWGVSSWQILRFKAAKNATFKQLAAKVNALTGKAVGDISTSARLKSLKKGQKVTMAWLVKDSSWLLGRSANKRAPQRYLGRG